MKEDKIFWSSERRKYISGKLGELAIILAAGGILSDVFTKINIIARIAVIIIAVSLLAVSIPIYPMEDKEKEG